MEAKFLVDMYSKKIFGPYRNKRKMEKDLKNLKKNSDMFLEEGSNILIMTNERLRRILSMFKG